MTPTLHTNRLTLEALSAQHTNALQAFYATERSTWVGGPSDKAGCAKLLKNAAKHWEEHGFGLFAISLNTETDACGMTGVGDPEWFPEAELLWALWDEKFEGRGIATEAAIAARDFYYRSTGAKTVVSYIHPDNTASIAMAKRLGANVDNSAATPNNNNSIVYRHQTPEKLALGKTPEAIQ
ncbi:MAG: GNAT family N-acetyltransferase [Rhodobacteraceae bacterium]|nr:GNAT family N-acetyltransferase [Paracoccaceae bacterium]